jgi:hypothetical protein
MDQVDKEMKDLLYKAFFDTGNIVGALKLIGNQKLANEAEALYNQIREVIDLSNNPQEIADEEIVEELEGYCESPWND